MKLTKRKVIAAAVLGGLLLAGVAATVAGASDVLLLLTFATLVGGLGIVVLLVVELRRGVDRRLRGIEQRVTETVRTAIADDTFLRSLRHMAMPQEHADQLLRTIEAGHARAEASQQQLARRIDSLLEPGGARRPTD